METAAVVALGVLATAALVQGIALAVVGVCLVRATARLESAAAHIARRLRPGVDHLQRTLEEVAAATGLLSRDASRAANALETGRRETKVAATRAARDARGAAASVWTMALWTRALGDGIEAYRRARPGAARPWHRAIDQGLATYRTAEARRGGL